MEEQQKKSDITKRLILEAAEIEFSEKGLYGARVDEIALRAKINKGMIYQYFGNKEELYKVALEAVYNRLGECESKIICNNCNCIEEISEIIKMYFYFLKDNPAYVRMLMWENLNYGKYFEEKSLGISKNTIRTELDIIITEGKNKGEIDEAIDGDHVFQTLVACSFNYFSNIHTLSKILDKDMMSEECMEERINTVTKMLVDYIKKK